MLRTCIKKLANLSVKTRRNAWVLLDVFTYAVASLITFFCFRDLITLDTVTYIFFTLFSILMHVGISAKTGQLHSFVRYNNIASFLKLFATAFTSCVISYGISAIIFNKILARYVTLMILLASTGLISLRLLWQSLYANLLVGKVKRKEVKERVLVVGAGEGGYLFMQNHHRNPAGTEVVAILDDDRDKHGLSINGVSVLGGVNLIPKIAKEVHIDKVIVAIPSIEPEEYKNILKITSKAELPLYKMPSVESMLLNIGEPIEAPKVDISDLLGREEVKLDESKLHSELSGKALLITGAGGSIGSEICRQVSKHNPSKLVLLGHGENSIYAIHKELAYNFPNLELVQVIADVKDYDRILEVFTEHKLDIVYHAAAYKHVPLMEMNPTEAFTNNIKGTYNVAKAVDKAKVGKMVMVSTDKAVRPPNVMGASKRICELIVTAFSSISESIYCAVRFGNVLRSRGSVIPVFEEQIARKEPLTITDFRMERYFMTIPEASRLVIYAGAFAKNGEIFVLDMGEPVKIYDLAKSLILLSGHKVEDIGVIEVGIRPGEKIREELLTAKENIDQKLDDKIFIGKSTKVPLEELDEFIEKVEDLPEEELKQQLIEYANTTC